VWDRLAMDVVILRCRVDDDPVVSFAPATTMKITVDPFIPHCCHLADEAMCVFVGPLVQALGHVEHVGHLCGVRAKPIEAAVRIVDSRGPTLAFTW